MHTLSHSRSASWVVKIALVATLALVATEFVAGMLAHSLALISDGWHNFTDIPTRRAIFTSTCRSRRPRKTSQRNSGKMLRRNNQLSAVNLERRQASTWGGQAVPDRRGRDAVLGE